MNETKQQTELDRKRLLSPKKKSMNKKATGYDGIRLE